MAEPFSFTNPPKPASSGNPWDQPRPKRKTPWLTVLFGIFLILAAMLGLGFLIQRLRIPNQAKAFKAGSSSMCPTICIGERIIADMGAFDFVPPKRGDLIMFEVPFDRALYIKRVLAVGGDVVKQGDHGEILVNDAPPPPIIVCDKPPGRPDNILTNHIDFDPLTVPSGSVFVLGDNLDNSFDSRMKEMGLVRLDQIRGRPVFLYWSPVFSRIGCKTL